jgi:triacylglycerol lipase
MTFTVATVIPYGLLVMFSMDIYRQKTCPPAPAMPPPPTGGGTIIGFVMGTDSLLLGHPNTGLGGDFATPVCYGTVVRRGPSEIVVALRGTDGFQEWAEDGQFLLIPYTPANPLPPATPAGSVEQGFWGIYQSLQLTDIHGVAIGALAEKLPALAVAGDSIVAAGHSLGAPLATYLTLDLARGPLAGRVSGCYFASPHPGDQAFATLFDQVVGKNYIVYNYLLDIVPRVPPTEFGYCSLSERQVIQPNTAQADISFGVACNHHVVCYLAMLDYAATMAAITPVPAGEEGSAACIRGPATDKPTLAKSLVNRIVEVAGA